MQRSAVRRLVDERLQSRGTNLGAFLEQSKASGRTLEEAWIDLRKTTGIPFAVRTLYRWAEEFEEVAS